MSISFNKASLIKYLDSQKVSSKDIETVKNLFDQCDELDGSKDGNLSDQKSWNSFQSLGLSKLAYLKGVIGSWIQTQMPQSPDFMPQMSLEELKADQIKLAARIEKAYTDARDKLVQQLKTTGKYEHPVTHEKLSAENLIKYLNNLTFKPGNYGTAQARKETGEIEVNTTLYDPQNRQILDAEWSMSESEVMKVLLHEALHNEYLAQGADPGFNTQAEERFCESNAIRLIAQLTQDDGNNVYGIPFNDMAADLNLLDSVLEEKFIGGAYKNRPKDASGTVTIEGHELIGGARVFIDGEDKGVLGPSDDDCLILDQLDSEHISASGQAFGSYNKVVLNYVKGAKVLEIKDSKGKIFKAYLIPNQNQPFQKTVFGL